MNKTKQLLVIASIAGFFSNTFASVTIDLQGEVLRTSSGVAIPTTSRLLLVADTSGNGFGTLLGGSSIALNQLVAGTDDRIAGIFDMNVWNDPGVFQNPSFSPDLSSVTGWTAGDPLALIWLPTHTNLDTALVGSAEYGIFFGNTLGGTGSGGDNWITPTDGNPASLLFFTSNASNLGTGAFSPSLGNASLTITGVPEPSRSLLALLGFGVLALRRRR